MPEWTEGVCGDGAAILRDGEMVPVEDVVAELNRAGRIEGALRELLDAFNPTPRVSTRLTIWGRAAMTLDGTPDSE